MVFCCRQVPFRESEIVTVETRQWIFSYENEFREKQLRTVLCEINFLQKYLVVYIGSTGARGKVSYMM